MFTKFLLLSILILTGLIIWILPKTKLIKKIKMTENTFYISNFIGILFSCLGLVVSFIYPELILKRHYYEIILLPIFFVYMYIFLIQRINKKQDIYDEKQTLNMAQAGLYSWCISIFWVFFIFTFYKENILSGLIFFPLYIFFTLAVFSIISILLFKKSWIYENIHQWFFRPIVGLNLCSR